ncbi:MAG: hypothetical protein WC744_04945 [Patescibacteria group bacterium]|jgi:hypothetical protein
MVLPKWATTVTPFSKVLALVIFITFPIISFCIGAKYQYIADQENKKVILLDKINKPIISISPSTKPSSKDKYGWQTYSNNSIPNSQYSISFPVGQEGWVLSQSTKISPHGYDVNNPNNNISDELILEKNTAKIKITRFATGGFPVCLYLDSDKTKKYMSQIDFNNHIEFIIGSRVARRAKYKFQSKTQGKDAYMICQKEKNSQLFVNITQFGFISYEVPSSISNKELDEMDTIIKSLKVID